MRQGLFAFVAISVYFKMVSCYFESRKGGLKVF